MARFAQRRLVILSFLVIRQTSTYLLLGAIPFEFQEYGLPVAITADMARMEEYCRRCRLKPSVSKTVCTVFHLQNANSGHELKVTLNSQPLRHEPHSVYLGITLDRIVNYKQQLTKIADNPFNILHL